MNRRQVLGLVTTFGAAVSGCSRPTVTEQPSGEIDVSFTTTASESYLIRFRLVDADGTVAEQFESEFPPDQTEAPSFFGTGFANGPYTVTIETDVDSASFEWSVTDCPRLDVDVTLLANGRLEYEGTCSSE